MKKTWFFGLLWSQMQDGGNRGEWSKVKKANAAELQQPDRTGQALPPLLGCMGGCVVTGTRRNSAVSTIIDTLLRIRCPMQRGREAREAKNESSKATTNQTSSGSSTSSESMKNLTSSRRQE